MSMIDRLEPRRLMAADAYVNSKGTLFVTGTNGADAVSIAKVDGGYQVRISTDGGATKTFGGFSAKRVQQIRLDVGAGDDRVTVEAEVNERATLLGGAGDDRIDLFARGPMLVDGGSGGDRIRHDVTALSGATGVVSSLYASAAAATATDAVSVVYAGSDATRATIGSVGDGSTYFYSVGGQTTLNGGGGNDVIVAGAAGDVIDGGTGDRDRVQLRPGIQYLPASSTTLTNTGGAVTIVRDVNGTFTVRPAGGGTTTAGGSTFRLSTFSASGVTIRRAEIIEGIGAAEDDDA